eukprot:scaffold14209_cov112-Isochrysis_galbana.AAC.1
MATVKISASATMRKSRICNHLIEYDLTQYTAKRTQQKPTTQSDRIRQRHTEWVPEAGSTQVRHRRKRPVGSQWDVHAEADLGVERLVELGQDLLGDLLSLGHLELAAHDEPRSALCRKC